jgi:transposase
MRPGVTVAVTAVDRRRLGAIIGNRNVPQKHAWRAEIVLLTADGLGTVEIMRRTGKSKTCVWRWQERFAAEGVDGLLRDKTRPPRVPPLGQEVIDQVVALTATEPPHEATHWTGAAMAKAVGTVRNLVCGAIVTPTEGAYGDQERHPGPASGRP